MKNKESLIPFQVGLVFILGGLLVLAGWTFWSATRTWVPMVMPVSLSAGHIKTPEFKVNLNTNYIIEFEVEKRLPYETLNCLLGVESIYPERCSDTPSLVRASWIVRNGPAIVARGSTNAVNSGSWTDYTIARTIGSFQAKRGQRYSIDVNVLTDGTRLNAENPRLKVRCPATALEYESLTRQWVFPFSVSCVAIGMALLFVGWVRYRRSHLHPLTTV